MKTIILDTNFVMIPAQFKVDIFSEIERLCDFSYTLAVLDKTISELNELTTHPKLKIKDRVAAKLALQLINSKKIKILKTQGLGTADDFLSEQKNSIVATQDSDLKKRLKGEGIKIITLRSKKKLIFS